MIKSVLKNIRYSLIETRNIHGKEKTARLCRTVSRNIRRMIKAIIFWPKIALTRTFLEYFGEKLSEGKFLNIHRVSIGIEWDEIPHAYLEMYYSGKPSSSYVNFFLDEDKVIQNDIPTIMHALIFNAFTAGFNYGDTNLKKKIKLFLRLLETLAVMNYPVKSIEKNFPRISSFIVDQDNYYMKKKMYLDRKYRIARKYTLCLEKNKQDAWANVYLEILRSLLWKGCSTLARLAGTVVSRILQFKMMELDNKILKRKIDLNMLSLEIIIVISDELNATLLDKRRCTPPSAIARSPSTMIHFTKLFVPLCFIRLNSEELKAVLLAIRTFFCRKIKIPLLEKYAPEFGIGLEDMAHALELMVRFGPRFGFCISMAASENYWSFQRKYNKKFKKKIK